MDKDYTADDRREGEDVPGRPNLEALRNLWAQRDDRYAVLGYALKQEAIVAIIVYRIRETEDLPPKQRAIGYVEALTWAPPR